MATNPLGTWGNEINNSWSLLLCTQFVGIISWRREEIFNEIMLFHYTTYIATPGTRTPAPGIMKITILVDPSLWNITIYPVCLTYAWERTLDQNNYCTDAVGWPSNFKILLDGQSTIECRIADVERFIVGLTSNILPTAWPVANFAKARSGSVKLHDVWFLHKTKYIWYKLF